MLRHPAMSASCQRSRSGDVLSITLTSQGQAVAQSIGAKSYKECSALRCEGVDDIFEAATRAAMLVRSAGSAANPAAGRTDETGLSEKRRGRRPRASGDEHGGACGNCVLA